MRFVVTMLTGAIPGIPLVVLCRFLTDSLYIDIRISTLFAYVLFLPTHTLLAYFASQAGWTQKVIARRIRAYTLSHGRVFIGVYGLFLLLLYLYPEVPYMVFAGPLLGVYLGTNIFMGGKIFIQQF